MKKLLDLSSSKNVTKFLQDQLDNSLEMCQKKIESLEFLKQRLIKALKLQGFKEIYFFHEAGTLDTALFFHIYFKHVLDTGKNQILTPASASFAYLDLLKKTKRFQIIPTLCALSKEGCLDQAFLKKQISSKTIFFTQRLCHPILGIHDPNFFAHAADLQKEEVLVHLDVTGSFGEKFFDFEQFPADFISLDLSSVNKNLKGFICFSKEPILTLSCMQYEPSFSYFEKVDKAFEDFFEAFSEKMLKNIQIKASLQALILEKIPQVEFILEGPSMSCDKMMLHLPNVHAEAIAKMLVDKNIIVELGGGFEQSLSDLLNLVGIPSPKSQSVLSMTLSQALEMSDCEKIAEAIFSAYNTLLKGAF
jgi:cysteine sulfinate desulfinase/cysteine desulfurase-like protein